MDAKIPLEQECLNLLSHKVKDDFFRTEDGVARSGEHLCNILRRVIAERDELRKRCRYNLDSGAQVTNWDEYEWVCAERDALKARIENAPKVWLVLHVDGSAFVTDNKDIKAGYEKRGPDLTQVYAVPVEDK